MKFQNKYQNHYNMIIEEISTQNYQKHKFQKNIRYILDGLQTLLKVPSSQDR